MILILRPFGTPAHRLGISNDNRQRATLAVIFSDPVRAGIAWTDIEALLAACGAEISEGCRSRIRVALNGVRAVFHRPHPRNEADKGAVKSIRRFLRESGIEP